MCVRKENMKILKARATGNSWRRLVIEQFKPGLPRSIVKTAKVNLNRYWSKFEQLSANRCSLMTFRPVKDCNNSEPVAQAMTHSHPIEAQDDNVVNENISNEIVEGDYWSMPFYYN